MSLTTLLNDTVDIQEKTRASVTGGWTEAWVDLYGNEPCRLQPLSANEVAQWNKPAGTTMAKCYIITNGQVVTTANRVLHGTNHWNILGVRDFDLQNRLTVIHLELSEADN